MITVCLVHFRGLTLANLAAALYSVRRQDLSCVKEVVIFDNDSGSSLDEVQELLDVLEFPVPIHLRAVRHGDASKTHAWSTNQAASLAMTPWVLFTRSDYLLHFDLVKRFTEEAHKRAYDHIYRWDGFVTSNGCHLQSTIEVCEQMRWREVGPQVFNGVTFDYTSIDSGVWMMRADTFKHARGLDERLTLWGHAQTEFQHRLFGMGVEFIRIPEVMFWHPHHAYAVPKDLSAANEQLASLGLDLKGMWSRYHGVNPYA